MSVSVPESGEYDPAAMPEESDAFKIQRAKSLLESLACSQGHYGRLLNAIYESEDPESVFLKIGSFARDPVDIIIGLEDGSLEL